MLIEPEHLSPVQIRPMQINDWRSYRDMRIELLLSHGSSNVDPERFTSRIDEDWYADLEENLQDAQRRRFIAEVEGQQVGMVGVFPHDDRMQIGGLYVRPEFRSRKIASGLLVKSEEFAKMNVNEAELWVSTGIPDVRKWYERQGYVPTAPRTTEAWWNGENIENELLIKTLI